MLISICNASIGLLESIFMFRLMIVAVLFTSSIALASPSLKLGKVRDAKPGDVVEIPIHYESDGTAVAIQFDVFFDADQFSDVDFDDCVIDVTESHGWSKCNRLPPPNDDVIRFIVFGIPYSVIQSGKVGVLKFAVSSEAVRKTSVLHIDECSSLSVDGKGHNVEFLASQLYDGYISVSSKIKEDPDDQPLHRLATEYFADSSLMPVLAKSRYSVEYSRDVQAGADELLIDVPGVEAFQVSRKEFKPRKGYVPRVGCGNQMVPDPNASASEMSYRWYGENEYGHPTAITVTNGYVHGFMTTTGSSFEISGNPKSGYEVIEIDSDKVPPAHQATAAPRTFRSVEPALTAPPPPALLQVTNPVIEMLVLYTDQARTDAGGQAALNNLIIGSVDDVNTTFQNTTGLEHISASLVHTQLYPGYVPTDDHELDLLAIQSDPFVIGLRDQYRADVVSILVADVTGHPNLQVCGASFAQYQGCLFVNPQPECGPGLANFKDWAFNWVSVQCARLPTNFAFTHELGHNFGGFHPQPTGVTPEQAAFPWAFAHNTPNSTTVLGVSFGLTHLLRFSNPDDIVSGFPLGIVDEADNGRVVEVFGPEMANFRLSLIEDIFRDSFESP